MRWPCLTLILLFLLLIEVIFNFRHYLYIHYMNYAFICVLIDWLYHSWNCLNNLKLITFWCKFNFYRFNFLLFFWIDVLLKNLFILCKLRHFAFVWINDFCKLLYLKFLFLIFFHQFFIGQALMLLLVVKIRKLWLPWII